MQNWYKRSQDIRHFDLQLSEEEEIRSLIRQIDEGYEKNAPSAFVERLEHKLENLLELAEGQLEADDFEEEPSDYDYSDDDVDQGGLQDQIAAVYDQYVTNDARRFRNSPEENRQLLIKIIRDLLMMSGANRIPESDEAIIDVAKDVHQTKVLCMNRRRENALV